MINNFNFTTPPEPREPTPIVSDNKDEDEDEYADMPPLEARGEEDVNSSDDKSEDEIEEPKRPPIARKKTKVVTFKDVVAANPIPIQEKLPTYNINEARHKWGHHGEERLKKWGS